MTADQVWIVPALAVTLHVSARSSTLGSDRPTPEDQ